MVIHRCSVRSGVTTIKQLTGADGSQVQGPCHVQEILVCTREVEAVGRRESRDIVISGVGLAVGFISPTS